VPTSPFRFAGEPQDEAAPAPAQGSRATWPAGDVARPLAGLRIVDFGWVWAGAVPGHIFADLGAEVIKVESMKRLDYMRQGRPIFGKERDPEQNPMFQNVNRAKLSLRIDMTQPAGARVVEALVARSHAVIENFSPGVLDKFDLGWKKLSAVRPGLVMCAMSAVGQAGPLRDIRTYATMIAGLAGLDSMEGYPGERVLGSQSSYADPNASLHATIAILAALWRQRVEGVGAYIDLSQWEAAVNVLGREVIGVLNGEPVPGTRGIWHARKAPYGHYPASGDDRWIAISVADDAQWRALCEALGSPAWANDARFGTQSGRCRHRAALDEAVGQSTRAFDADTLGATLRARGVPAQPVLDVKAVASHPHFVARRAFQQVDHPVLKSVPIYAAPWQIDHRPMSVERRAPLMGEHNGYVLGEVLGMPADEIEALRAGGVLD
jgi:benzylsuccinate CoA-transferase BbsF subunit